MYSFIFLALTINPLNVLNITILLNVILLIYSYHYKFIQIHGKAISAMVLTCNLISYAETIKYNVIRCDQPYPHVG